jgi:hypothetical protein
MAKGQQKNFSNLFIEPIGGAPPKLNTNDKLNVLIGGVETKLALVCPAQGYPIPAFRYSL